MFDSPIPLDAGGVRLTLRCAEHLDGAGRKPVLLLHGASANHRTFTTPDGDACLASSLLANGFDPWLLDWRGSGLVFDDPANHASIANHPDWYNFNEAARLDVRAAIQKIRELRGWQKPIAALGFCMGSAVLAEAVAEEHITDQDVDCLVLMTLGLFYTVPIDGRLKSEDRTLEELRTTPSASVPGVDPRPAAAYWPASVNDLFKQWPAALKWHADDGPASAMCNRVSFMYGMPYCHDNLVSVIHGVKNNTPVLASLFGAIPLEMYIHGAQNIRAGEATYYRPPGNNRAPQAIVSDRALERFKALRRVTLITGDLNRLWHRDSIDRMYEWLMRGSAKSNCVVHKHVMRGYGHQDLLWGAESPQVVFTPILDGLSP